MKNKRSLEPYYDSRSVRLDLLAFDENNVVYDAEAQQKNIGNRSMRRRSRVYQSYIDVNLLTPGETDFGQINDIYIIFIAPFDLFGLNKYMYTFRMRCDESTDTTLDDGAVRIYLNTRGTNDDEVPEGLVEFLHYMEKTCEDHHTIKDPLVQRLAERVQQLKNSQEMSVKYMLFEAEYYMEARMEAREEGLEEGRAEGLAEGLAEGRAEGKYIQLIEMVCRKLKKGKDAAAIAAELDENPELITGIFQAAAQTAPDYDYEQILESLDLNLE